ncbi:hypothetical protein DV735_g365, partial [Chaetothyriales sp. CBS 134920]
MAASSGTSFKPNVNRTVTKKWKEAAPVAGPSIVGARSSLQSNRSVTNPAATALGTPAPYEHRPDRRAFSAGGMAGLGFESAYPTAQRNPFPEIEHDFEPDTGRGGYAQYGPYWPPESQPGLGQIYVQGRPPPLSVHTQGVSAPRPGSRSQHRTSGDPSYSPLYPSQPASRSSRHESPGRPDSRSSYASAHQFPPRKSSLSTAQPVIPPPESAAATETDGQPTPTFVRPVDIYKRLEEERERGRSSLDSARPSIDLARPRTRDGSASAPSAVPDVRDAVDESDSARKLRPTLDTVVERKSEYGFDNLVKAPAHGGDAEQSSFGLPDIDHSPPFGPELASLNSSTVLSAKEASESATQPAPEPALNSPDIPPAVPAKHTGDDTEHDTGSLPAQQPEEAVPLNPQRSLVHDAIDNSQTSSQVSAAPLSHQTSLGYHSVVHQAFDNSQNLNPVSPVSRSDTVVRSNSASTSDISPIMANHPDPESNRAVHSLAEQRIAEEDAAEPDRPLSRSTLTPTAEAVDPAERLSTPPPIKIGYRRDFTPPSGDNSPAKRPISVTKSEPADDDTGAANAPATAVIVDEATADHYPLGHDQASIPDSSLSDAIASPRAAAGDDEEWPEEQQPDLSPGLSLLDHKQTRPSPATPLLRTDSPAKGTVRQLAEKLELQSAQSSPTTTTDRKGPFPFPSTESFRPALPGGWQSYNQSSAWCTPAEERSDPFKPAVSPLARETNTPTADAGAAADAGKDATSPLTHGFAPAAAGSAALAGAAALTSLGKVGTESDDSSDDGWNNSPVTRSPERPPVDARASEPALPALPVEHLTSLPPTEESQPPTPLPKDSPVETSTEIADEHGYAASDEDYFPAPLRTAKAVDFKPTAARLSLPALLPNDDESATVVDHEQLQHDIVKSLTPMACRSPGEESVSAAQDHSLDDTATISTTAAIVTTAAVATTAVAAAAAYPSAQQSTTGDSTPLSGPPQLIQRFSWEPDSAARSLPTVIPSADAPSTPPTAKTPLEETPATDLPAATAADHSLAQSPDTQRSHSQSVSSLVANPAAPTPNDSTKAPVERDSQPIPSTDLTLRSYVPDADRGPLPTLSAPTALPPASSLGKLMEIGNHQARVDAYNQNRELYAQPDGLLEQWILSLKGYPEHADAYVPGARPLAPTPSKLFPNRPLPSIGGGGKLMQEDGKRLMAAAGRFGGKAGGAAKGLFARGKEKLRHASASSDKGSRANSGRIPPSPRPLVDRSVTEASKASAGSGPLSTVEPPVLSAAALKLPAGISQPSPIDVTGQTQTAGDEAAEAAEADQSEQAPSQPPRPSAAVVHADGASSSDLPTAAAAAATDTQVTPAPDVAGPPSTAAAQRETDGSVAGPSICALSSHAALAVPGAARSRSLLSEISSASPRSAQHGDEGIQDHPISPHSPAAESLPSIHSPLPSAAKAVESADEQAHLPPLRSHPVADGQTFAETETSLKSTERPVLVRPFSFVDSLGPTVSNLSAKSINKSVAVSGLQVDADNSGQRQLPETGDRDQPSKDVEPGRLQSPTNPSPLPSARRPQPDLDKPHVVQVAPRAVEADEEEGYRIPGPYHQEYRSPRQTTKPVPHLPHQNQGYAQPGHQPLVHDSPQQQSVLDDMQPVQEAAAAKHEPPEQAQDRTGEVLSAAKQRGLSRDRPATPPAHAAGEQGEGKKNRLSALFSRSSSKRGAWSTQPPQRASTLPVHSPPPVSEVKGAAVGPPYEDKNGAYPQAQQPHTGYDPPLQEDATPRPSQTAPYAPSEILYNQQSRATTLRIDTTNSGQLGYQHVATAAPTQSHGRHDSRDQPQAYVSPTERMQTHSTTVATAAALAPAATSVPRGPSPHVLELHKRSRSPKLGPYPADGDDVEPANAQDITSVGSLGTFSNKKISPVGGIPRPDEDQEAPFRITLPGEPPSDDEERLVSKKTLIEQGGGSDLPSQNQQGQRQLSAQSSHQGAPVGPDSTAAPLLEPTSGPPVSTTTPAYTLSTVGPTAWSANQTNGAATSSFPFVAELPGSKAIGYESDDDADYQMSATAYPGQWQDPVYFDESRWED